MLTVSLLTGEEVTQFDTGFGEPDGATLELEVVGVARTPTGVFDTGPLLITPALVELHPESVAGVALYVELRDGRAGVAAFTEEVAAIAASADPTPGGEEFLPAVVEDPLAGTRALDHSSRVLVGGMAIALAVAVLAALLALAQATGRHHARSAGNQGIERALGMTAWERSLARAVPWVPAAVIAAVGTLVLGVATAGIDPVGALANVEPEPGWRLDLPIVVGVPLLVLVGVWLVSLTTAWRAGRPARDAIGRSGVGSLTSVAPRRRGWTLAGSVFALSSSGRGRVQSRTSLVGAVLGVIGMVAGLTFAATLDRLTSSPERYGWTADFAIADVDDETVAAFVADPRFDAVVDVTSAMVRVGDDGELMQAYVFDAQRGVAGWVYHDGRSPQWSGEIAVGTKAAEQLGVEVGDSVEVAGLGPVEVVGIGLGPPLSGEPLGSGVLLDPDGARVASVDAVFREVLLRASPGEDVDALMGELGAQYELFQRELPAEVQDLAALGALPEVLGGFLATLAILAVVHGIAVTARHRARDLAVLRALGSTPRQAGLAVVAMGVATAVVGLVLGLPLGWAVARLVWSLLADSVGIEPGVALPATIAWVVAGGLVLAVVLALLPARRVARQHPATVLRAE